MTEEGGDVTGGRDLGPGAEGSEPLAPRLTEVDRAVRTAAFREILATGRPWDPASATDLSIRAAWISTAVDHLVEAGRARTAKQGWVTAAGLSTRSHSEPR